MQKINLSYETYYNLYGCGAVVKIPQSEFLFYARLAAEKVASECTGEYTAENEESLLLCTAEVAEAIYLDEKSGNIESETIDGYSVKYSGERDIGRKIHDIILKHLANTTLLYKGV